MKIEDLDNLKQYSDIIFIALLFYIVIILAYLFYLSSLISKLNSDTIVDDEIGFVDRVKYKILKKILKHLKNVELDDKEKRDITFLSTIFEEKE